MNNKTKLSPQGPTYGAPYGAPYGARWDPIWPWKLKFSFTVDFLLGFSLICCGTLIFLYSFRIAPFH